MKDILSKNIKHIKVSIFILGFIIDWTTLPKVTHPMYIWIGPIYILLLVVLFKIRSVAYLKDYNYTDLHYASLYSKIDKFSIVKYTSILISFFLGSLLSYVLVYYFKTTDLLFSWPIIIFIIMAIFANEFIDNKISDYILFFIGSTFYFIFNIPIFYKDVNDISFILSLSISVLFSGLFLRFIKISNIKNSHLWSTRQSFVIYAFIIIFPLSIFLLYYFRLMPAVPLFLKEKGFYTYVQKEDGEYYKGLDLNSYPRGADNKDTRLYFYSSVVSPLDVSAKISHIWYMYNTKNYAWDIISTISFNIQGGREDGYRGYSYIKSRGYGEYKVIVKAGDRIVGQDYLDLGNK